MKKIGAIVTAGLLLCTLLASCGQPAEEKGGYLPSGNSSVFSGSGFIGSGTVIPTGSGFMDEVEAPAPKIEEPKYKTIGAFSQDPSVKRTLLLNLTGKDIIGFAVKASDEPGFSNKLLLEGDIFKLDEIREVFYSPLSEKETETQTTAAAAQTTEPATQAQTETAGAASENNNKQYDVQITFSDWSVYVIHDLPFDDMKLGRLLLQNDILFLEYTSEESGKEIITRQKEYDIKAAEWQAYQQQLAQQQAQAQAWQQQQQQQPYVAPASNNDAGCIGDTGLMW